MTEIQFNVTFKVDPNREDHKDVKTLQLKADLFDVIQMAFIRGHLPGDCNNWKVELVGAPALRMTNLLKHRN